ncbi:MarR family transcriptional regulator [Methanobrevibacter sp.]|uniref:MarR family transcriptional regulator n=1 Tax=Methanobrevibacter sp. TaxID=66852 RepID=UPI00388E3388
MCESEEFLELVAYVRASNRRMDIIKFLSYDLKTPKEIGNELNIRTNHISNLLADLRKRDLVVCVTPNVHKGRLYKLTDNGNKVLNYL